MLYSCYQNDGPHQLYLLVFVSSLNVMHNMDSVMSGEYIHHKMREDVNWVKTRGALCKWQEPWRNGELGKIQ